MKTSELQTQYSRENNCECVDSIGNFTDGYVQWLQDKIISLYEKPMGIKLPKEIEEYHRATPFNPCHCSKCGRSIPCGCWTVVKTKE